ncbi:hypothetical protein G6F48_010608 [Rhizopus delemar]|nr:hypothetical protein G6F48_010608 [Rhizopus delemar]
MLPDLPRKFDNKVTDVSQLNLEADESEMIVCYTTSTTNNEETAEGNIDETEENDNTEQDEQCVDIVECKKRLREAYETILMYEVPLDDFDLEVCIENIGQVLQEEGCQFDIQNDVVEVLSPSMQRKTLGKMDRRAVTEAAGSSATTSTVSAPPVAVPAVESPPASSLGSPTGTAVVVTPLPLPTEVLPAASSVETPVSALQTLSSPAGPSEAGASEVASGKRKRKRRQSVEMKTTRSAGYYSRLDSLERDVRDVYTYINLREDEEVVGNEPHTLYQTFVQAEQQEYTQKFRQFKSALEMWKLFCREKGSSALGQYGFASIHFVPSKIQKVLYMLQLEKKIALIVEYCGSNENVLFSRSLLDLPLRSIPLEFIKEYTRSRHRSVQ